MAISQARIIESMEQACSNPNPDEFIFSFLDAYGFPKTAIFNPVVQLTAFKQPVYSAQLPAVSQG